MFCGLWFVKRLFTPFTLGTDKRQWNKNIWERQRIIKNSGPKKQLNLIFYQTTSYKKLIGKRRLNVYANFL
jgi:hypothetical protein